MAMYKIKSGFPLDAILLTVLQAVVEEATSAGIDCMLVGATARDLLLTHVFGIPARRATHDVDFAVAVADWAQFEDLKTRLLARKGFDRSGNIKQRLYYGGEKAETGYPIDLVPFGGITDGTDEISWPPDMAVTMNVVGYGEVLTAAVRVEIAEGVNIRVASLPGLTILKLVAWSDRGAFNPKDAHDLYHLMANYAQAGNFDRLYGDEFPMLEAADHDPDVAGACLLGKDVALLATDATQRVLKRILEQSYEGLALEMVKSIRTMEDAIERVETRLRYFVAGIDLR